MIRIPRVPAAAGSAVCVPAPWAGGSLSGVGDGEHAAAQGWCDRGAAAAVLHAPAAATGGLPRHRLACLGCGYLGPSMGSGCLPWAAQHGLGAHAMGCCV